MRVPHCAAPSWPLATVPTLKNMPPQLNTVHPDPDPDAHAGGRRPDAAADADADTGPDPDPYTVPTPIRHNTQHPCFAFHPCPDSQGAEHIGNFTLCCDWRLGNVRARCAVPSCVCRAWCDVWCAVRGVCCVRCLAMCSVWSMRGVRGAVSVGGARCGAAGGVRGAMLCCVCGVVSCVRCAARGRAWGAGSGVGSWCAVRRVVRRSVSSVMSCMRCAARGVP